MKKELRENLCEYLGELMAYQEAEFDWIRKDKITEEIRAVNLLLGFETNYKTWYEKVIDGINKK